MSMRWVAIFAVSAAVLGGCGAGEPPARPDPFSATGEMIAWSGGAAGPRAACFTCHGLQGEGDGAAAPRLAGLPRGYLSKQLQDYADGPRRHDAMHAIASRLPSADRDAVAAWYASLQTPPVRPGGPAPAQGARLWHEGDAGRGLRPCAACHGRFGEGVGQAGPPLAGQSAAYVAEEMKDWRSGKRQNDPERVMLKAARPLTEAELQAVAAYAASLPGASVTSGAAPATEPWPPGRRPDPRSGASAPPPRAPE